MKINNEWTHEKAIEYYDEFLARKQGDGRKPVGYPTKETEEFYKKVYGSLNNEVIHPDQHVGALAQDEEY